MIMTNVPQRQDISHLSTPRLSETGAILQAHSDISLLSTPRLSENDSILQAPRKRPRVQLYDRITSDADKRPSRHESQPPESTFSFSASNSAIVNKEQRFAASPALPSPAPAPVADEAAQSDARPPLPTESQPVLPGFQFVPENSQPVQPALLYDFDTSNADIEVITLDTDDDVPQSHHEEPQPTHPIGARAQPQTSEGTEVIDLDDDEALANLQPLPITQTRLHISRGGGLFRVQAPGQLEIVDSDDEEELTRTHRLIGHEDGLHTISSLGDTIQQLGPTVQLSGLSPDSGHERLAPHQHLPQSAAGMPEPQRRISAGPSPLVPQPNSETSQALQTTQVESSFQFFNPMITRWPQPSIQPVQQQPSVVPPSTDMFMEGAMGGPANEPLQFQTPLVIFPSSQPTALPNSHAVPGDVVPLSRTTWLNARSPQALLQAQQRIALARTLPSPASTMLPLAGVNPSATGTRSTQISNQSASLRPNNSTISGSLPAPEDNGISAEGLRNLVKQNGLTADATEEADTPSELNVPLMAHQRRALHWMSKREMPVETDEEISAVDEQCLGGILADDQGLGKTLTMIALMLKNRPGRDAGTCQRTEKPRKDASACQSAKMNPRSDESVDLEKESSDEDEHEFEVLSYDDEFIAPDRSDDAPWKTLIVCPLSVINQWKEEICSRIRTDFIPRVCVYHGPRRERRLSVLENCDVVITTYATLVAEYPKILKDHPEFKARKKAKLPLPKRSEGPLCSVSWNRVVLDEAQHVKNRGTDSWSAVMSLRSEKRWCLTGTPIQNSVDDIYSLFCFIRYHFVPNYETWNTRWKKKLEHSVAWVRERAFKRFQTIVGVVLLRRTKNDTIKGAPLISLPKRLTEIETPEFCDKEEEIVYKAVQEKSVLTFNKFLVAGTLANNYSSVLLVLLRLRQACSHPFLIEYAGMHNRGRSVHGNSGEVASDRYSTSYSAEDLEEAMELVAGGYSSLSMIEDVARQRVEAALLPPAKGKPPTTLISCQYCQRGTPWPEGCFLACGDLFCPDCCQLLRRERRCLRCLVSIEDPNVAEVFINADEVRKEVHARTILGDDRDNEVTITASEFKSWFQLEVIKRRSCSVSDTVTPETTDVEVDDAEDDEDDEALDQLEKSILEKKTKASYRGAARADCPRVEAKKERLLRALSQHSTKIRKILDKLNEIRKRELNEKTLIFSQWTSMLDIIEFHVQLEGHEVCRLDGSMSLSARQKQIEAFKASPTKNVFLISLHAGGTGLNLTAASNVIISDVWWNPAVEEQAIDRVHRIGQTKDVNVTRFKMKDTVEERIYAICAKKREAADGTLGVTGAQSLGRKKLSLQELMYIFGGAAQDVAQSARRGSEAAEAANNILNYQQFST